jgi:glycosyltransferase involved in cell wall biosynthesis
MKTIPVRLGLQQRILPTYRKPFFDTLGAACSEGLSVLAGLPRVSEMVQSCHHLDQARLFQVKNHHILGGKLYLCWQEAIVRWLEEWNPEVLIVEANPRYLSTSRAVKWMNQRGRPVIGWGLGDSVGGQFQCARRWVRRNFLSQFNALITYSASGARGYVGLGFDASRIFVAPNAVAASPTQPPPYRPSTLDAEPPLVLFVGRLQSRKRVDLLIQACSRLSHKPRLWVVGDGPAKTELEKVAERFFPETKFWGALHGVELESLFKQADLFVLPGTGGLAVQQAMSFALPVMVAEADGTQSDLVRQSNGWLIPPGDFQGMVRLLEEAFVDIPHLRKMGLESYRIIKEEINLEQMTSVFVETVSQVIK